jgi:diguanylate cyclase (GGDEF)-like protein
MTVTKEHFPNENSMISQEFADPISPLNRPIRMLVVIKSPEDYQRIHDFLAVAPSSVFKLDWVTTYQQAVSALTRFEFDVCLFDHQLEPNFGLDFLREIPTTYLPVILLTEGINSTLHHDAQTAWQAMSLGAANCLDKSELNASLLERSIRYAIHHQRKNRVLNKLLQSSFDNAALTQVPPPRTRDQVTDLSDRIDFSKFLWMSLNRAKQQAQVLCVLCVAFDRFKEINTCYGWEMGNALLKSAAERLQAFVGMDGEVSRLNGAEFGIVAPEFATDQEARLWVQQLSEQLIQPFRVRDRTIFLRASIGASLSPQHGRIPDDLINYAEIASRSSEQDELPFQFYSPALEKKAEAKRFVEISLMHALERSELEIYYQPQMDLKTGMMIGMEALLRWQHPDMGDVPASIFVPIAEETGLIVPLGQWVLRTVCTQIQRWQKFSTKLPYICVNLSVQQLQQKNFLATVAQILEETKINPSTLVLEITETSLMRNVNTVLETLTALKQLGIRIAIDDFGEGFSSLNYLCKLPIDVLKIDKSFIHQCTVDSRAASITHLMIKTAHTMKLNVVAEGVETQTQLAFLRSKGCDAIQGFLYSTLRSVLEIESIMNQSQPLPGI